MRSTKNCRRVKALNRGVVRKEWSKNNVSKINANVLNRGKELKFKEDHSYAK